VSKGAFIEKFYSVFKPFKYSSTFFYCIYYCM